MKGCRVAEHRLPDEKVWIEPPYDAVRLQTTVMPVEDLITLMVDLGARSADGIINAFGAGIDEETMVLILLASVFKIGGADTIRYAKKLLALTTLTLLDKTGKPVGGTIDLSNDDAFDEVFTDNYRLLLDVLACVGRENFASFSRGRRRPAPAELEAKSQAQSPG